MRKAACLLTMLILLFCMATPVLAADVQVDGVSANSYIVIDAQSGQVLVQKNAQQTSFPASITKMMTMALAYEKAAGKFDDQIVVSKAVTQIPKGSSHVALLEGEVIKVNDALNATLLASANDGANALAEYTSGSIEAFVDLMNQKAAQLGATGTHFANAHGFHDPNHYVTAEDMAKITKWAYSINGFEEFMKGYEYVMEPTNRQPQRKWGTENLMLVTSKYYYEGTIGGKSGYTPEAQYTMIEIVQREGRRLISVVLGCNEKYAKFSDSTALMNYCFNNFRTVTLKGSDFASKKTPVYGGGNKPIGEVAVNVPDVTVQLPAGVSQSDLQVEYFIPEKYVMGQPFGASCTISFKEPRGDMPAVLATVPLVIGDLGEILARSTGVFAGLEDVANKSGFNIWTIILGGVALCAIALIGGRIAYVAFIKAQRRKRKMERMRRMYMEANFGPSMPAETARAQTRARREEARQSYTAQNPHTVQTNLKVVIGGGAQQHRVARR